MGSLLSMGIDEWIAEKPGYNVSVTATSSTEQALPAGRWEIVCTTDCWVERGATGVATTVADLYASWRPAGLIWYTKITSEDVAAGRNYFSAIKDTSAADGTLYFRSASRG